MRILHCYGLLILLNLFNELFKQSFAGDGFLNLPVDLLYTLFFEFGILGNEVRHDVKACDLCVANDTDLEGLVELLGYSFRNDFLARTVDSVVLVEKTHFMFVRPDEFGQFGGRRSWVRHDRMNACIFRDNELRDTMGVKYGGLSR